MKLMRWNGNELDWNEAGEMEWKSAGLGMRLNKKSEVVTYILVPPH